MCFCGCRPCLHAPFMYYYSSSSMQSPTTIIFRQRQTQQMTGVALANAFAPLHFSFFCCHVAGTPSRTVMKTSKRVYDAEAPATVRTVEPIAVTSKPPLGGYSTGGAPQTVAAPEGASLGTVAPVPVNTSKFGRFRKTGKPVASAVVLPSGQHTTDGDNYCSSCRDCDCSKLCSQLRWNCTCAHI